MTQLAQAIEELQAGLLKDLPEEALQTILSTTQKLVDSGIAEKSIQLGDSFTDFSLPNATGNIIHLKHLLEQGPLVVVFYRGDWCPYCNLELATYKKHIEEITNKGANLIAITPQLPDNALTMQQKHDLPFEVLSDTGNQLADKLGLVFTLNEKLKPIYQQFGFDLPSGNGDNSWTLPIPATFIINQDATVRFRHVDADYSKRAEPAAVVAAL
ncbi:MAG: AhpC/TSA family protein [Pseudomonadales bacterium]|nr:AhpC/TSA family protein [Pseudomonadales bacterium]